MDMGGLVKKFPQIIVFEKIIQASEQRQGVAQSPL
jgi:hypothetical protein